MSRRRTIEIHSSQAARRSPARSPAGQLETRRRIGDLGSAQLERGADERELVNARERALRALVDLLDRLLAHAAVLSGEVTLAIAGIDLVHISLRALITSIEREVAI